MNIKKHQQWRNSFPHYKVQYWDNKVNAWHPIQKSFNTEAQARLHGIRIGVKYRIAKITREERSII